MNKMYLRTTTAALCMLTAGLFVGCGKGKSSGKGGFTKTGADGVVENGRYTLDANTPAWKLDKKENTKLTWYVNADWWNTDWGNDVVTKKVKEDLKLDVVFLTGDDTKLNTFFASGRSEERRVGKECR